MAASTTKTVLITGASGGIGYQFAVLCAKKGHDLILVARSDDKLEKIKADLESKHGIAAQVYVADLSVSGKARELYDFCHRQKISVDYLINNAGFGDYQPVANADPDTLTNMINLNIIALTELTALFVKDMVKYKSGRILNVASTAAYQPVPMLAVYAATKSYVVSFTEALHAELKGTGVFATVLSPGITETGFVDRAAMSKAGLAQGSQASATDVAKAGYHAMMKGKLYVIPGFINKLLAFGSSIMPSRRLVLAVSSLVSKEKK